LSISSPFFYPCSRACVRVRVSSPYQEKTTLHCSLAHTCTPCSNSRRQGVVNVTIIARTVIEIVTVSSIFSSPEVDESNTGIFHGRVLRAVAVQVLKIIVVASQILTQVGALVVNPCWSSLRKIMQQGA
ncbi:unnamed protein product, partial [Scytosiphon promiscuus]